MSPALRTRPQDSRFFWNNNSSWPESQRILLVRHQGRLFTIIVLHISLVLGEYSRYLVWQFGFISLSLSCMMRSWRNQSQTHEDTHQGEKMVSTKSQDHFTSPGMPVKYIAFSFAQPCSFSYPIQDPYWFTVYRPVLLFSLLILA